MFGNEVTILLNAMRNAGDVILSIQRAGMLVERKANNDLVTTADLQANEILKKALIGAFPLDGWLSEESVDDDRRMNAERVWVVDPIDGTIEFASGIPEYAVSVALIEHGDPILAAVYNPVTQELFHAVKNEGAWLNDTRISCKKAVHNDRLLLLASRSEDKRGEWEKFKQQYEVKIVGSIAYKLALVAAGKADATFSLGPKSEWDIAAGVLLVNEAGGLAVNRKRRAFTFNQHDVRVDGVVGTAGDIADIIFSLIDDRL